MKISPEYRQKIYAGVLGKMIGVYLGRPVEGWPYEQIRSRFPDVDYYVHEELDLPLIVADDDLSGTFGFFRAVEDADFPAEITPRQIGETWLNYIIENKSILWWGGLGNSTEHTAYLRLKKGIPAPQSGSMALNGPVISQQIDEIEAISNQIFAIVIEQSEKADQIRRFMDYYLPTTLKMLSSYRRMEENNASGEQARKAQEKIRETLDTVIAAFTKQLNQLFEEEAMDIATDIDVMESMLRQDGLIDSGLKVKTSTGEEK